MSAPSRSAVGPRLLILVVAAGALAVYFAVGRAGPPPETKGPGKDFLSGMDNKDAKEVAEVQAPLWKRDLPPGEAPEEPAELHVNVTVDRASGKNRLRIEISEAHGYYVQHFRLRIWYTDGGTIEDPDESPHSFISVVDRYLKTNDTLVWCAELNPAELDEVGGSIGTDEDWAAEVVFHDERVRLENPDPLPELADSGACR